MLLLFHLPFWLLNFTSTSFLWSLLSTSKMMSRIYFHSYWFLKNLEIFCASKRYFEANCNHLKCYQESKRGCQLMRLVPVCQLTWLHTSPTNTNTNTNINTNANTNTIQIQIQIQYKNNTRTSLHTSPTNTNAIINTNIDKIII